MKTETEIDEKLEDLFTRAVVVFDCYGCGKDVLEDELVVDFNQDKVICSTCVRKLADVMDGN